MLNNCNNQGHARGGGCWPGARATAPSPLIMTYSSTCYFSNNNHFHIRLDSNTDTEMLWKALHTSLPRNACHYYSCAKSLCNGRQSVSMKSSGKRSVKE